MPKSLLLNDYNAEKLVSYSRWIILLVTFFLWHSPAAPFQTDRPVLPAVLATFSILYITAAHFCTALIKEVNARRRYAVLWTICDHAAAAVLFFMSGDGAVILFPAAIFLTVNAAIGWRFKGALASAIFLSACILAGSDWSRGASPVLFPLCFLWISCMLTALSAVREVRQKAQIGKLTKMVYTDFLTGLANRRAFHEHLNLIEKTAEPCFLILADVDNFKMINDYHGHLEGDEVLRKLGGTFMKTEKQSGSRIYRYGGEEFAFLVPGSREEEVIGMLTGLIDNVVREVKAGGEQPVTMSFGVSLISSGNTKLALAEADELLYQAKTGGKSRAIFSSGLILKNTMPSRRVKNA
jgi:diguanylate cyclase